MCLKRCNHKCIEIYVIPIRYQMKTQIAFVRKQHTYDPSAPTANTSHLINEKKSLLWLVPQSTYTFLTLVYSLCRAISISHRTACYFFVLISQTLYIYDLPHTQSTKINHWFKTAMHNTYAWKNLFEFLQCWHDAL